ncbi:unnamed protein product [Heterotrigona itama]|uniref:Uncharacterized protein n=1 Tax=Heterotrigona itama TaxID=395501 RepID=A0A6V7GUE9_9HYME|nr:unnamed protein product [Heterotrigona itama]
MSLLVVADCPTDCARILKHANLEKKLKRAEYENEHSILGDNVGLAISQSLGIIGSLQHAVKRSGEMISHAASVERILKYTNLPQEVS